jgi:hypothetical protein
VSTPTGALSDRSILRGARRLRALALLLEVGIDVVIAGSVIALASVHAWAYVPVWYASFVLLALATEHELTVRALRRRLGPKRFAFHPTGLWVVLDEERPYGTKTWSFDLGRPRPLGPLVVPGLLFLALVGLQLVPLPPSVVVSLNRSQAELVRPGDGWTPLTLSVTDTLRGLGFLASLLALHAAAAVVLSRREARERFRRFVACLGAALALHALAQRASGTRLIYGVYRPIESDGSNNIFGPFVNRNHFAGYMLLVVPLAMGLVVDGAGRYLERIGPRGNVRRWLVALLSPEGSGLLYFVIPALVCLAALIATGSRGALVGFGVGLGAALLAAPKLARRWAVLVPLVLLTVAASWSALPRLEQRFGLAAREAGGRTVVWRDALGHMRGLWPLGSGFNTFGLAVSRVTIWKLPVGATPWREPYETSVAQAPRLGFRAYLETTDLGYYREAHNDYLQVLVETGVPGLVLVLLALTATLRQARTDPWRLAAIVGIAVHSFLDFDLQIPAVAVLFVCVAAPVVARRRPGAASLRASA